jgi:hypothetical protein
LTQLGSITCNEKKSGSSTEQRKTQQKCSKRHRHSTDYSNASIFSSFLVYRKELFWDRIFLPLRYTSIFHQQQEEDDKNAFKAVSLCAKHNLFFIPLHPLNLLQTPLRRYKSAPPQNYRCNFRRSLPPPGPVGPYLVESRRSPAPWGHCRKKNLSVVN